MTYEGMGRGRGYGRRTGRGLGGEGRKGFILFDKKFFKLKNG